MNEADAPNRRPAGNRRRFKSHLVNGAVRARLVADDLIFALAAALTAIGILYYISNREIGDNLWSAHVSIKETRELLTDGVKVAGVVTFVAVLLFGIWSVIDAHRIAGPMHRLKRLLNEIADGDLNHDIHFRGKDEFQDVALASDRLVDEYAARLRIAQSQVVALERTLSTTTLTAEQIVEARAQVSAIRDGLGYFRVPEAGASRR